MGVNIIKKGTKMCQVDVSSVKVAEQDIIVWKVLHKRRAPFYFYSLNDMTSQPATGFDTKYGYHVCSTKKDAQEFKKAYLRDNDRIVIPRNVSIHRLVIPKGSKYVLGVTESNCIGGGLPSIRCERLSKP